MLQVTNLSKTFKVVDGQLSAVNNVSFTVPAGQFASIIGRSGSGKSTLLTLLGALDKPTSGSIQVGEWDITRLSGKDLTRYRGKEIGFIFQNYNLVPNLTALENVMLPMEFIHMSANERKVRAIALMEEVGLSPEKQRRRPGKLSGGEQQRVAIARALANRPKLILADEPTGNLDTETSLMIYDLLRALSRVENTTIVVVTHDLAIASKADITYHLQDGVLVQSQIAPQPQMVMPQFQAPPQQLAPQQTVAPQQSIVAPTPQQAQPQVQPQPQPPQNQPPTSQ